MIDSAYHLFVLLVGSALACCLWRIWKGPTIADRINAADVVALCCVGLAVGHGWKSRDALWLDIALVAGFVLFVGTTAVSLFLTSKDLTDDSQP